MPAALSTGTGLAIAGGASLLSGVIGAGASKKAASTQADANTKAAELAYQMYQQTAERLKPWVDTGGAANKQLAGFLGLPGASYDQAGAAGSAPPTIAGTTPAMQFGTGSGVQPFPQWNPTMEGLKQTPGFQFTLDTGERAMRNTQAAMGLGESGSLLQGVGSFASGLASQTYGQQFDIYEKQFNNYWSQLSQVYNMLSGVSGTGENAAANVGQAGAQAAATGGNFLSAAGTNLASGTIGAASALGNSLNTAGGMPLQLAMMKSLGQFGSGGGGTGPSGQNFGPDTTYT